MISVVTNPNELGFLYTGMYLKVDKVSSFFIHFYSISVSCFGFLAAIPSHA